MIVLDANILIRAVMGHRVRQLLDEDDWPVLATALGIACAIWTEDADFFGTGIAVWTTSRIEIFLRAQAKVPESEEG